ncbi:MAG: preprotein translocase subunit SecE [Opitutales bacterium]|nr:preprotein translocase subunit SecE [Opitutales bacterium]
MQRTHHQSKVRQFYQETVAELKKASWPTRPELVNSVIIVFVALGLLGAFVSLVDFAIYNVVDLLTWFVKGGN